MTQDTTAAANLELVRAGIDDLNAGDLDACVARAAPGLVMNLAELPEPRHGSEAWQAWRQGAEMMRSQTSTRTSRTSSPPTTASPSA